LDIHLLAAVALLFLLAGAAAGWLTRPRQPARHLARRFGPDHQHPAQRRRARGRKAPH
jgi:hypothetical protein